jgi:hypothetical protein
MGQSAGVFDPSHTSPPISGCYHCTDPKTGQPKGVSLLKRYAIVVANACANRRSPPDIGWAWVSSLRGPHSSLAFSLFSGMVHR